MKLIELRKGFAVNPDNILYIARHTYEVSSHKKWLIQLYFSMSEHPYEITCSEQGEADEIYDKLVEHKNSRYAQQTSRLDWEP